MTTRLQGADMEQTRQCGRRTRKTNNKVRLLIWKNDYSTTDTGLLYLQQMYGSTVTKWLRACLEIEMLRG